jgi:ribosomal-protein-alanine N-acetyltransferase
MRKDTGSDRPSVRRLEVQDAVLALDTIRQIKQPEARAGFNQDYMSAFLSRPENVLIVSSEAGAGTGFLLGYLMDRVDGDQRMVCLYEIEVAKSHRRRGIGRALLEVLIQTCHGEGVVKVWAVTNRSNEPAVAFYSNTGAEVDTADDTVTVVYGPECLRT